MEKAIRLLFAAISIAVITACGGGDVKSPSSTPSSVTPSGAVTTFAGAADEIGVTNGTGAAARFAMPMDVAVDSSGNVYVADASSSTIRKITSAGVVTTFAGTALQKGNTDGTGADARFNSPQAVAVDSSGNVYVTEYYVGTIRKITSAGVVTTFAGTPGLRSPFIGVDGTGAGASFSQPHGIAVDSSGNVYVADYRTIRKITSAGVVTTLAGPGDVSDLLNTGSSAYFRYITDVAVDYRGNVYAVDAGANSIKKITSAGVVTTFADTGTGTCDADGASARFNNLKHVAVDSSGNVYVSDGSAIQKITIAGAVTTFAGAKCLRGSTDGTGAAARFDSPEGIAIDSSGTIYVADYVKHTIRKITP